MVRRLFLAIAAILATAPAAAEPQVDPLKSPVWSDLAKKVFGDAPYVFDDAVKVSVPHVVENQAQAPIIADARGLADVKRLIVFSDLNPIQLAIALEPQAAAPFVGMRLKVEQSTPIRAAALTADGTWHVGGVYLEAAGGGCTSPAAARSVANWWDTLGEAQGRVWPAADGYSRVRFRIRHPMDTGLAKDNTPAYFIESIDLKSESGSVLATLKTFEPVGEDPTITLLVKLPPNETAISIDGRDNNGQIYRANIPTPRTDATSRQPS